VIKVMWVSGFFYLALVLLKSVTELALSFADVFFVCEVYEIIHF